MNSHTKAVYKDI